MMTRKTSSDVSDSDMTAMEQLTLANFRTLFSPNVRALLDWRILAESDAIISSFVISEQDELKSLFTVWHTNPDGEAASWDDVDAKPQTIGEAIVSSHLWEEQRKVRVKQFQSQYASSTEPVNLLLPAYEASGRFVLLDSTHRAVTVAQEGIEFTALVIAIRGVVDERVLPDLRWHEQNPTRDTN